MGEENEHASNCTRKSTENLKHIQYIAGYF